MKKLFFYHEGHEGDEVERRSDVKKPRTRVAGSPRFWIQETLAKC